MLEMDYKLLVDTAVLAGEIMLTSGAETYRVEDTIRRILKTSGFERCDVFAIPTGIMVTLADPKRETISITRRIGEKRTDLGNIYKVNEISRWYCNGDINLSQAFYDLKHLSEIQYNNYLLTICMIVATAGFTLLLGGGWIECMMAAFNGIYIVISKSMNNKIKINTFVLNMVTVICIAFTSMMVQQKLFQKINLEILIAGSCIPLLPGVAITNAIRDTLQGDYTSGTSRAIEAFVIAISVGVGIGVGLAVCGKILGEAL